MGASKPGEPAADPSALVDELLAATRRRRRWNVALALTPLAVAGAVVGALEVRMEELIAPVVGVGSALLVGELAFAIEAGLASNRAARAVAASLGAEPRDSLE
jgi:hypothetical protein